MTIATASTGATLGTATFHAHTLRIDTTVRDNAIALQPHKFLGWKGHKFSSNVLNGQVLRWKYTKCSLDIVCVDERDVAVARFHFANWSVKKCGRLELIGSVANENEGLMEEVMVTGLAMAEYVLATWSSAVAAAVA